MHCSLTGRALVTPHQNFVEETSPKTNLTLPNAGWEYIEGSIPFRELRFSVAQWELYLSPNLSEAPNLEQDRSNAVEITSLLILTTLVERAWKIKEGPAE